LCDLVKLINSSSRKFKAEKGFALTYHHPVSDALIRILAGDYYVYENLLHKERMRKIGRVLFFGIESRS
jgi:hypothetical protein